MSQITVERIHESERERNSLLADLNGLTRERAFAIFERRNGAEGTAMGDWLSAERDLALSAECELEEGTSKFQLSLGVGAFADGNLAITALSDALVVFGRKSEQARQMLFNRFDLPEAIDVDRVTADLHAGILRITATKASAKREKSRSAAA
jgi:HSP20 family molecular chaperone IbpA